MCRWLAYAGPPLHLDSLIVRPENSLIDQSRDAHEAKSAINADGFGIGWYGSREHPGLFRDVFPAWNDENLRNVCEQIQARLFFGHVRASTGAGIHRANCHPFRHGSWLFMHNGQIGGFDRIRRELVMSIAPEYFSCLEGTTDSEVFFYLALSNGLKEDPETALAVTIAQILNAMQSAGVKAPFRMTAAISDGNSVYGLRYASDDKPPSLYYACGVQPHDHDGDTIVDTGTACLIVSEPLDESAEQWVAVEADHLLIAADGGISTTPFNLAG